MSKAFWSFAFLLVTGCMSNEGVTVSKSVQSAAENINVIGANFKTPNGHQYSTAIFHPNKPGKYPLVIFSHGNFGSPDRYHKLLKPIAVAGYILVAPIHQDAEILALDPKPTPDRIWQTRNNEIAHLGSIPSQLSDLLIPMGTNIDRNNIAVMGHSYGALIAQLAAGAVASDPGGSRPNRKLAGVDALVAFSPPGRLPNTIDAKGWSSIDVPSLTVTGSADILPGFIDDWRLHKAGYEATPKGARWLWVGKGVDHYFGGSFGREKPVEPEIAELFDHALAATIQFLDRTLKNNRYSNPLAARADVEFKKD